MRRFLNQAIFSAAIVAGTFAYGASDAPTVPVAPPATQPIPANVAALISQLGDESYAKREEAADALKKLGKEAIPALTQAAASENPQIRTSSQAIVSEIRGEDKPKPGSRQAAVDGNVIQLNGGMIRIQGGGNVQIQNMRVGGAGMARMQVQMVVNGETTKDMTVDENGRKVHIHEDSKGIKLEVTENGKTKETEAKDAAELKKNDPEAFKVYEKYNGNGNGEIRIEQGPQQ